jgi:hypothetical protein
MPDSNTQGAVKITPEELNKSFHQFRQDLIVMPIYGLEKALPYVTIRPGVRYKETVGELEADMELAPFDYKAHDDKDVTINGRTLETFLGNAVKGFDPISVVQSIYGSEIVQGDGLKNVPITKKVWTRLMGKLSQHLYDQLFIAKRVEGGKTTATLFNGFCTIADAEITSNTISTANGNYHELASAITSVNALDSVNEVFDSMDEHLKDDNTMMLMSPNTKLFYERDYQSTHGALPYNQEFKKTFVEGSDNKCQMVGLSCIPTGTIIVTTKSNLLVGIATSGPNVSFECKPSLTSHFLIDFVASMFFGTQFESINRERLLYCKVKTA